MQTAVTVNEDKTTVTCCYVLKTVSTDIIPNGVGFKAKLHISGVGIFWL